MTVVLAVDDDRAILRTLTINLRARDYEVEWATDGRSALQVVDERMPDVIILDLGLPDLDGVEVLRRLRSFSQVPVVVLSARHDSDDKVEALDAGADDYVTKPFDMAELLARVRAAARRSAASDAPLVVESGDVRLDVTERRATRAGEEVRLTPTEWHIVEVLARRRGRLVRQSELLHEVWGPGYDRETNYLRVYLAQLRRKLEVDPSRPRLFLTDPGIGYRLVA
ncbi:response regulator [Aeromicrobium sp. SMF47]|uniref:Response regulator n=1 Tax=Aeromicrobium yanjiei TaxID=2662028 RepID=A0A5Q2ML96_9ACTN|nr:MULTISPECIES: response regulator transcription factor [Aeromicrobium]MRJ78193.1 response regulator [Aeromicrobium yanjiei]MRK03176.1 response regulator [Aeromicrobium sp. S22]QGG40740.1 response regulator [Aeromicrobium yanjiei]